MYNIKNVSMTNNLTWFAKRYNTFLVDFPQDITSEVLKTDDLCSRHDSKEAHKALQSAHKFLSSIAAEMFLISKDEKREENQWILEKTFSKIDLFWGLVFYGELYEKGKEYCLAFKKESLKSHRDTLPASYAVSLNNIIENGCYIEYFKDKNIVNNYRTCDRGLLHFDDRLTALGIYLFIKKASQKKWYSDNDSAGNYSKKLQYEPVKHCAEPFYRIDMRIFNCNNRLIYDIKEELAGYNEEFIGYFENIYNFVKENYPDCLPDIGVYGYIYCPITFIADENHRMLGQLGIGYDEDNFGFYTGLTGKEAIEFTERIDEFDSRYVVSPPSSKAKEIRFFIASQLEVEQAIKLIDIKARHKQKTLK